MKFKFRKFIKMFIISILTILVLVFLLAFFSTNRFNNFGAAPKGARLERMKQSPHFDGEKFFNPGGFALPQNSGSMFTVLKRWITNDNETTPKKKIETVMHTPEDYSAQKVDNIRFTWLGHSTLLLEIDSIKILTDPVWKDRVSPSSLVGPKRFYEPPITLEDLPKLDAVIISHDHYDHLDEAAVKVLAKRGVKFITGLGVGAHLESWDISPDQIFELDWWEDTDSKFDNFNITATPARHFSGRGFPGSQFQTLWASWVIEAGGKKVYFSADVGDYQDFESIRDRFESFDLTFFEIGAYDSLWSDVHLTPEKAVTAFQEINGKLMVPIHWGTFNLALHSWNEPPQRLLKAAGEANIQVYIPRPGQIVNIDSIPNQEIWWE